jgi:hypothetical protein
MPQETKSDIAPGVVHENLEGWIPPLASEQEIRIALEKAFDYRGDVTITRKDGSRIEGYIFDRRGEGETLANWAVRLLPRESDQRITIPFDQIARLEFTGRDTAAGKSFETWVKNYHARKAAGEKNIRIDPEKLD